jgi:hypothetical protein
MLAQLAKDGNVFCMETEYAEMSAVYLKTHLYLN